MTDMTRRDVIRGAVVATALTALKGSATLASKSTAGERPNILCLCFEDGPPHFGAYGDTLAHTPTVDRLAREGVVFEHAYTTQPVCGPSRFAMLTGMYPESAAAEDFGTEIGTLPVDYLAYPQIFREAGYYCTNNFKTNYNSQFDFVDLWDESSPKAHWKNRPEGEPFLAVFNGDPSHESCLFDPAPSWKARYEALPASSRVKPEDVRIPAFLPDTPAMRRDFATSYDYLAAVDGMWAERLRELEEAGVAEDTIILVYSDHGGITPRTKRFCYEQGAHIPTIVYMPEKWRHLMPFAPGTRVKEVVSHVDLMPTLLSLAGIEPPQHLHGRAYLGSYRRPAPKYVFTGRDRMDERYDLIRSATDGRYRYIRNYYPHRVWGQHLAFQFQAKGYQDWEAAHIAGTLNPGQDRFWRTKPFEELYDVETDPDQMRNLVDEPAMRAKLAEMRAALDEHILKVNDNGFIPEGCSLQGYSRSRAAGQYPLAAVMALAGKAASRQPRNLPIFVRELGNENECIRYWAALGLLMLGSGATSATAKIKAALLREESVPTRIVLAEALIGLSNDSDAMKALILILFFEVSEAYRLQALTALAGVGQRALPAMAALQRMTEVSDALLNWSAAYSIRVLTGKYDPLSQAPAPPGAGLPWNLFSK